MEEEKAVKEFGESLLQRLDGDIAKYSGMFSESSLEDFRESVRKGYGCSTERMSILATVMDSNIYIYDSAEEMTPALKIGSKASSCAKVIRLELVVSVDGANQGQEHYHYLTQEAGQLHYCGNACCIAFLL